MPNVSRRAMVTAAIAVLVGLALTSLAAAQDTRIDAAKKEGKVVWYTSLALPSAIGIGTDSWSVRSSKCIPRFRS